MSSAINQTADILSGLKYFDTSTSKTVTMSLGLLLLSLPCFVAYKSIQHTNPPAHDVLGTYDNNTAQQEPLGDTKRDICVSKLLIHPIKSCRGISVKEAKYTPEGLENDRLWSIAEAGTNAIITAREYPRMVLITPTIQLDSANPHGGMLVIAFPENSECETLRIPLRPSYEVLEKWRALDDAKLWSSEDINCYVCEALNHGDASPSAVLSKYLGKPMNLLYKGPRPRFCHPTRMFPKLSGNVRFQDDYPLLIMSEENIDVVNEEIRKRAGQHGVDERWKVDRVVIERFRPNIVLSGAGPFAEDMWKEISINNPTTSASEVATFSVVTLCTRCLLPNVDVNTGARDHAVPYKVLMKFRLGLDPTQKFKPCLGCYAVPHGSGVLRVGEIVTIGRLVQEE